MLNLIALVTGTPSILRKCKRYNNAYIHHQENVAEHMFYTAFYVMMIGRWLQYEKDVMFDLSLAIRGALVHDVDEHFSGDIVRPFKHFSPELRQEIDKANQQLIGGFFKELCDSEFLQKEFAGRWKEAKNETKEGKLVAFADYIAVLSFLYHEVFELKNHSLYTSITSLKSYAQQFLGDEYSFLHPLPTHASNLVDKILEAK